MPWTTSLVQKARELFSFVDFRNFPLGSHPYLEYIMVFILFVVYLSRNISVHFIVFGIIYSVITVYTSSKVFQQSLMKLVDDSKNANSVKKDGSSIDLNDVTSKTEIQDKKVTWDILKNYYAIKKLAKLISKGFGGVATWCLATFIISLSQYIDNLIFTREMKGKVDLSLFLISSILILILAAEVVANVRTIKLKNSQTINCTIKI